MRWIGSRHASGERLIAYADNYLDRGQREILEEHLRACPRCRDRLRGFDEVARIVQRGAPLVDDPAGRAALHARLAAEGQRAAPTRRRPTGQILAAASALVLLLGLLVWPLASEAGFPLGRFVRFGTVEDERDQDGPRPLRDVAPASVEGLGSTIAGVAPDHLPLGLSRVSRSMPEPGRLDVLYRSPTGLAVLLTQAPAASLVIEVEPFGAQEVTSVRGTPVLQLEGAAPGTVAGLYWERGEVVFELLVTEAPPERLRPSEATRLVEALMTAQDAGPG